MTHKIGRPWILLITHGRFGEELVKSCELVLGKLNDVYCFSLLAGMTPEELMENVASMVEQAPEGSIIFTDIYAGTPSNVAAVFAKRFQFPVICGVNLPILIEAEMSRGENSSETLVEELIETGIKSIINITKIHSE